MAPKFVFMLAILVGMIILASCQTSQSTPIPEANMPNPASVYCEAQGNRLEIVIADDGSQSGLCIFPDGSSCDEWAYYREECGPAQLSADQLVIETHELTGIPDPETLQFTSVDGRQFAAADFEISTPFSSNQMEGTPLRFTVTLNGDTYIASENIQPCEFEGCINVTRNGEEIFQTDAGGISPIEPLRGLWTYDNHWVLETNLFLDDQPFNGQIFVDGEALNEQNGYEESFNFQTINGRPIYFFRRNEKVDAWFDGKEIPLDYDEVPHYLCCGDSGLNPKARQGAVLFFGNKNDHWYFVQIAAPDVLDEANIPNPAAAYCEQQGYRVEIRTAEDGSQAGYCIFPDGSECDEWAYFRSECGPAEQNGLATSPTAIPTARPVDPADYQGWWTYTHPEYGFSIMLPEDWKVEEVTTSDPLMNGHMLNLTTEELNIRMAFRRLGEEALLWPTGVGAGEFIEQGTLEVAGQPASRFYFVCPNGVINYIWYHDGDDSPNFQRGNIQRGDLEFSFIISLSDFYCEAGHSLDSKPQHLGEMIIASLSLGETE